ncbi:DUF2510 domain-containing protein, partial [Streptomyces djakartensis]|uniref:DUF2510 domain-containing protein n=1 Tax=Streptomyces djakartensis TaxID=68193 RepID=UPI001E3DC552
MSAPTPAPGDDRPREGYYPDPSIPGYVRYWNGASWVPGTSRPAPEDGETLAPPSGADAASVEETGPHFFDEDPVEQPPAADSQHGSRPEPASAWGADRSRQSGFGRDQERVSWGAPQGAQGAGRKPPQADRRPDGESAPAAGQEADAAAADGTFVFRRPTANSGAEAPADAPDEGTMKFRAVAPPSGPGEAAPGGGPAGSAFGPPGGAGGVAAPGFGAPGGVASGSGGTPAGPASAGHADAAGPPGVSSRPGFGAGKAATTRAAAAPTAAGGATAQ